MTRDTNLDACRALVMINIVCIIHGPYWFGLHDETLRSAMLFEMPAIFFIAGAAQSLAKREKGFLETVKNRCKRLLVPFYIFLAILYIWMAVETFIAQPTEMFNVDITALSAADVLKTLATGGSEHIPLYGYTWFISCYLAILCSFPLQRKLLRRIPAWLWLAIMAVITAVLTPLHFPAEREIKNLPMYNFFFIAGYAYYKHYNLKALHTVWFITATLTIYGFAQGFMHPMQGHKFPADIFFLVYGTAWLSTFALILRRVRLPYNRLLKIWNVGGYHIYLYQIFSFYAVNRLTNPWIGCIGSENLQYAICTLLVFAASTALGYIINELRVKNYR